MFQNISEIGVKLLVIGFVLALLPASPFVGFEYLIVKIPYLSFVNWFLPISEMLVVFESWLSVVIVYYGILYLLNYAGLVKS